MSTIQDKKQNYGVEITAVDLRINDKPTPPVEKNLHLSTKLLKNIKDIHSKFSYEKAIQMKNIKSYNNHLLNTFMTAYNYHLPLHITPEDFHMCMLDIVSTYINYEPDQHCDKFVNSQDMKNICVNMDELLPLVTNNKNIWDLTIEKWLSGINDCVKDPKFIDDMVCNYSTSTYLDKIVSYGFIMNVVKHYISFSCCVECGIPKVYVHGTSRDWENLKNRWGAVSEFIGGGFLTYIKTDILPILKKLQDTKDNRPDIKWWSNIIHLSKYGSGVDRWSGWIIKLFPLINNDSYSVRTGRRKYTTYNTEKKVRVIYNSYLNSITNGLTDIPIKLNNNGHKHELNLHAGFHGVYQHPDGSVQAIKGYRMVDSRIL
jgi:hypothetical protein